MDKDFWIKKWENNETGFHLSEVNPILVENFNKLLLPKNSRVFIPLCGKTKDIGWLLSKGYRVAGAEMSQLAIKELFKELGIEPSISKNIHSTLFSAQNIDIFAGDIFEISSVELGMVNAIYDRAALVALPQNLRLKYTSHLMEITNIAPQLLIGIEYNQMLMSGPPFSVSSDEIRAHYSDNYRLDLINKTNIPGGLKGEKCAASQSVWLLNSI